MKMDKQIYSFGGIFLEIVLLFHNLQEINAQCWSGHIQKGKRCTDISKSFITSSRKRCLAVCLQTIGCCSVNFNKNEALCEMCTLKEHQQLVQDPLYSYIGNVNTMTNCGTLGNTLQSVCECNVIPEFPFMKATNFDKYIGSLVKYVCSKEAYKPVGNMTIVCQSNGIWNALKGKCVLEECPKTYQLQKTLNFCYKMHDDLKVNRTEAKRVCQENDGHLLVIDKPETQNFIESVHNNGIYVHTAKQFTSYDSFAYTLLSKYGYNIGTATSITMQIKACNDAFVGLMSENYEYSKTFYEIVIGGYAGYKSELRWEKQSGVVCDSYLPGPKILSCSQFRKFKISWTSGTIIVSKGDGSQMLSYKDPRSYQINFIGVSGGIWADVTFQIYTEEFYWISGQYINGTWMDDHNRIMSYFNWKPDQPDDTISPIGISLSKVTGLGRDYWFDDKQSENNFFICEYP